MATNKIQTGIRFDEVTLQKITYIAKKNCRSLNAQLEYLVLRCIEEYETKHEPIVLNEEDMYLK